MSLVERYAQYLDILLANIGLLIDRIVDLTVNDQYMQQK